MLQSAATDKPYRQETHGMGRPSNEPDYYLDRVIVRIALDRARKLVTEGLQHEEAVRLACPGSWSEWRPHVQARLRDHQHVRMA
jgi:hypothetical protein